MIRAMGSELERRGRMGHQFASFLEVAGNDTFSHECTHPPGQCDGHTWSSKKTKSSPVARLPSRGSTPAPADDVSDTSMLITVWPLWSQSLDAYRASSQITVVIVGMGRASRQQQVDWPASPCGFGARGNVTVTSLWVAMGSPR